MVGDVIAGITVATMLIPQSMAYALLAGLPPEVGLYSGILPVFMYGLFGSSRVLTFGPTAITSVLVLGSLNQLANPGSAAYTTLVLSLALSLGIVFILMALLRLGFIANLLSQPVLIGYVNAAALIILLTQLPNLFGVNISASTNIFDLLWKFMLRLDSANLTTLLISTVAVVVLAVFKYYLPIAFKSTNLRQTWQITLPRAGPLLVVVLGILAVYSLRLDVAIVGDIPQGLPPLTLDNWDFGHLSELALGAITIAFVGFMEAMSTAKSLQNPQEQTIEPNQELVAMGVANLAAAFTGGMPVTTSISRSAVNQAAGARTGLSSVVAALILAIVVLFLTPVFYFLPDAILAAIVLSSIVNLLDWHSVRQLWRYDRLETLPFGITFVTVLVFGVDIGMLVGLLSTVILYFWQTARPEVIELGRVVQYQDRYWNKNRHSTMQIAGVTIIRVDESLYFANVRYFELFVRRIIAQNPECDVLIIDFSAVNRVDASALQILESIIMEFKASNIDVLLAELKSNVLQKMERVKFIDTVGQSRFFPTVHDAVIKTDRLPDYDLPI